MHLLLCLVPEPVNVWLLQLNLHHTHICHSIRLGHLTVRRVTEVVCQGEQELFEPRDKSDIPQHVSVNY